MSAAAEMPPRDIVALRERFGRIRAAADLGAFASLDEGARGAPAIAVKENIAVAGLPRRGGSRATDDSPSPADAAVVAALRAAGCAILGTTSMHELALGVSGDNPHFGEVVNPRGADRIAGGSSSGSAAAVAAGLCDAALGTDTGGSVRLPAALCGVVGLKPRCGELSRDGVIAVSPTLDAVGVLAADVDTAGRVFALAGGVETPAPDLGGVGLALPATWLAGIEPEVLGPFLDVVVEAREVELPDRRLLAGWAGTISLFEASRSLKGFSRDPRLGGDVAELLGRGDAIATADYESALAGRSQARRELAAILSVDALVIPTAPEVAPRRGSLAAIDRDRLTGWTRPFNLTDSAAVSLPLSKPGLPAGIQVVAERTSQALAVARELERRFSFEPGGTS